MQKYAPCIPQEAYPGSMCEREDGEYYLAEDVDALPLAVIMETQAQRIAELEKALRDLRIEMMHNAALPEHQEWADAFEIINKSLAE